ncbi:MAG: septal ring lytic transglycosylase RlpA family protein [Rhodospirillaceae bacterium]
MAAIVGAAGARAWLQPVRFVPALLLVLLLSACAGSTPEVPASPSSYSGGGYYKVGKPYQIAGVWYYPAEDYTYDETGIGSWYGPGFHKERTANGEVFNQEELTAAHKTLPMPCLVRVTNLDTGRSIVVRVNDRGPFVAGRIIDMSHRAAGLLGYDKAGTAKVRVQILADESRAIAEAARAGKPMEVAAYQSAVAATPVSLPVSPPVSTGVAGTTEGGRFLPAPEVRDQPVGGAHRIFVQAGAFSRYENATRLKDRLASAGSAAVVPTRVGGKEFFRVRIGPITSVEKADAILNRVVDAGSTDARLVVD